VAKSINRPVFKVIGDRTLYAIAEVCPRSEGELKAVAELSPKQYQRHAKGLLGAVEGGLAAEPVHPPRTPRPNELYLARLETMRNWRKMTAREMQVKSDVVLPRDVMYAIAAQDPANHGELAEIMAQVPWRLDRFGDQILGTLSDI
jgi:ribonuclease D